MPDPDDPNPSPTDPRPDDVAQQLSAMADRRVTGADRPSHLPTASRQRIRRGERLGAGLTALVVVALVAGGVALARSGQDQATIVRVGPPTGTAECYPAGVPRALADDARAEARGGRTVAGATPRAVVVAIPTIASPALTVDAPTLGGWELAITGLHFVPSYAAPGWTDRDPQSANGEQVQYDRDLFPRESGIPADPASLGQLDPIEVSLSPACTAGGTTIPPASSTSTTVGPTSTATTSPVDNKAGFPDCVPAQVGATATTDRSSYRPGDTVTVTVTLRNTGSTCENSSPVDLIDSCPDFQVTDSSGAIVYQQNVGCPQPLTIGPIAAGYHRSVTYSWPNPGGCGSSSCLGMTCANRACDTHVPPGIYTITPMAGIDRARATPTTIRFT